MILNNKRPLHERREVIKFGYYEIISFSTKQNKNGLKKNLKQISLANALVSTHSAHKELGNAHHLINWSCLENLPSQIHIKRRG